MRTVSRHEWKEKRCTCHPIKIPESSEAPLECKTPPEMTGKPKLSVFDRKKEHLAMHEKERANVAEHASMA
jgi:hypothetical protein